MRVEHLVDGARDRRRNRAAQVADLLALGEVEHLAVEWVRRVLGVPRLGEVLELGRLQFLEAGVREVGDLLVVTGQNDRVTWEVRRVPVVVEVVEVAQKQRGPPGVDGGPRDSPRSPFVLGGLELQGGPCQLNECLLQPRSAAVGEPRRRLAVEHDVEEAGAGAEPERHLLGDLDAVEGEQVAKRGRAAVVAGRVGVAGDHDLAHVDRRPLAQLQVLGEALIGALRGHPGPNRILRRRLRPLDNRLLYAWRTRFHGPGMVSLAKFLGRIGEWGSVWVLTGVILALAMPDHRGEFLRSRFPGDVLDRSQLRRQGRSSAARARCSRACRRWAAAPSSLSFPSAHTTAVFAAATAMTRIEPACAVLFVLAAAIALVPALPRDALPLRRARRRRARGRRSGLAWPLGLVS